MKHVAKVVIIDEKDQYLLLTLNNHPRFHNDPDLPGGTVDNGEESAVAAIREVYEETAITLKPTRLRHILTSSTYSVHDTTYHLYEYRLIARPKVEISWEHVTYDWLSKNEFLQKVSKAQDTYMKMVYDVLSRNMEFGDRVWESGRESSLLNDIIAGRKTIEGRLNRDKFSKYRVGDIIKLRRDVRDKEGALHDGQHNAASVQIMAIRKYPDFLNLVKTEGFKKVIPSATSAQDAAQLYDQYYSTDDQKRYGVLAIEIKLIQ